MRTFLVTLLLAAITGAGPVPAQDDLPPHIRAKMLEADAGDALKAGDFAAALEKLREYRAIGVPVSPAMMYLEARAALAANDFIRSKRVFEEYFKSGGDGDPNFNEAMTLYRKMLPAAQAVEAAVKAAAQERAQKRLELKKRMEAEAAARTQFLKDCPTCSELAVIPAGSFDIAPGHTITFAQPFAISRTEVTFAQWDECVAARGCAHTPKDWGWGRGDRPVILVSWDDVQEYLRWLSRKTRQTYRLPSEAEWAYAARTTVEPNIYGDPGAFCDYGNVADETLKAGQPNRDIFPCTDGFGTGTAPVASFAPNPWGLYDVLGNVWEWVADCWHPTLDGIPADGKARASACPDNNRGARGRSWANGVTWTRGHDPQDSRWNAVGFRVVRDLEKK